ncbi:MAG TPA: hypothetical protein VM434_08785 [Beijerinckiaceae bacterium]|nr:hypothetical protein [Beijerinckiaceae bacterium]
MTDDARARAEANLKAKEARRERATTPPVHPFTSIPKNARRDADPGPVPEGMAERMRQEKE